MAIVTINGESYHIDNKLNKIWNRNSLETIKKQNTDKVYIIDGRERIGKSLFTIQQMGKIDPEVFKDPQTFVSRICFSADEFNKVCRDVRNGVIIFDEAFRGLSSRSALSKVNKKIIQTLMEMGQNNNIVFIVLPSFFLLDIYPAMLRSDGLFHIAISKKDGKRVFYGYDRGDKNKLYQMGIRKGWKYYVKTKFIGRFFGKFPGGEEFEKAYLDKKARMFKERENEESFAEIESRFMNQRDTLIYLMYKNYIKSQRKVADLLKSYGYGDVSRENITRICEKVKEKLEKEGIGQV